MNMESKIFEVVEGITTGVTNASIHLADGVEGLYFTPIKEEDKKDFFIDIREKLFEQGFDFGETNFSDWEEGKNNYLFVYDEQGRECLFTRFCAMCVTTEEEYDEDLLLEELRKF